MKGLFLSLEDAVLIATTKFDADECIARQEFEQMAKEMKGEKEVKHSIEDVKKQDTELLNALDKAKEEAYQKGKVDGAKEFAEGLLENLLLK